jgi:predicted ATPase
MSEPGPPLIRLPFVARTGAFADITAALDGARHARGSLVLITGEPGIGKTRLAEEVANHAEGFRVIWTWCTPAGVGGAMRPWSALVRSLAAADAGAARTVQQSPYLAALATAEVHPDARHADPETARWRLALDLVDMLVASAASQPTLVVIDDLHEGDPSSLQLLAELAPALRSMPVVVLATARDGERDWSSSAQVWGALNRLGHTIRLGPFEEADIASLLAQALGTKAPAEAVRTIASRTQGSPLLVCEVVRSRPHLDDLDAVVPASVRAIVAARLAGLTELTRTVVSAAAVLGTRFRLDVLAEAAEVPLAELGTVVGEAHAVGLFGNAEPGEGRFRHDLIRDASYEALPVEQRMHWHARAGAVLAVFAQRGRDIEAAQVADHLFRGGPECVHKAVEIRRPGC